jgi:hypothetical protein
MINRTKNIQSVFDDPYIMCMLIQDHIDNNVLINSYKKYYKRHKNKTLDKEDCTEDWIRTRFHAELVHLYIGLNRYFINDDKVKIKLSELSKIWNDDIIKTSKNNSDI